MKINGYYFADDYCDDDDMPLKISDNTSYKVKITPNTDEDKANALLLFCYENLAIVQVLFDYDDEEDWNWLISYGTKAKDEISQWHNLQCYDFIDNSGKNQNFTLPEQLLISKDEAKASMVASVMVNNYNIIRHQNGFLYIETDSENQYIGLPKEFGCVYAESEGIPFANIYTNSNMKII